MPAQSPTLSPTLSAMVAALRGSSSGMFCSTLPTRSAPTSAALVKMPPPTRMNIASRAAPKPKPSSTLGAFALVDQHHDRRRRTGPGPTVNMPTTPPVRNAIRIARGDAGLVRGRGHADVGAHRQPHADVAGQPPRSTARPGRRSSGRSAAPSRRPAAPAAGRRPRPRRRQRAELPREVRGGAFLHRGRDAFHVLCALAGRQNLSDQDAGDAERTQGDHGHDEDPGEVAPGQWDHRRAAVRVSGMRPPL